MREDHVKIVRTAQDETEGFLHQWLGQFNLSEQMIDLLAIVILCTGIIVVAVAATFIIRRTFLPIILRWVQNNNYKWDDALINSGFLQKASWFIPVMVISLSIDTLLDHNTPAYIFIKRFASSAYVIVAVLSVAALLNAINEIHKLYAKTRRYHLQAYVDALKIILYLFGVIFITSIITGRTPWGILSILGGLTAVTMLIFKDSILGFVASLQLTATNMVQVGDWIEMPQYGADGNVISMTIHTIRIQNFDKTITTIPTYALVSTSFKNWRGMSDSGGRRIKRSINIDMASIRFCSDEMLEKFRKMSLIREYIATKQQEIDVANKELNDDSSILINGRRQTNVGVFRAYIIAYLKSNSQIHSNMTFLVRQLQPHENGLPIEIYVFSKDQVWSNYEAIQADIFDHLLAAAPEFGLRIFQNPTGSDLRSFSGQPVVE